jgi:hypothetical protein
MFLKTEEPDIIWAFSLKRWTDSELAIDWPRRVFVLKTSKQGRHSILILDNHNSHIIREFQYYCLKHDIHPLYLPAHASHKLQPLDVGPFSPLSAAYGRLVQNYTPTGFATFNRVIFMKLLLDKHDCVTAALRLRTQRLPNMVKGLWTKGLYASRDPHSPY